MMRSGFICLYFFFWSIQTQGFLLGTTRKLFRVRVLGEFPPTTSESTHSSIAASIEDEIGRIIELYMKAASSNSAVHPSVLTQNAPYLAKGRIYEKVLRRRMEEATKAEDVVLLEQIDSQLFAFIQSERKQRSRLKVNYIIAGASSGRLDEGIELLHESDEIDEDLLLYINSLINRQVIRSGGPAAESIEDVGNFSSKNSIEVLRMIYRRLEAQMKAVDGKKELTLLAKLLGEQDPNLRERILKSRLIKVEDMENFVSFVTEGIEHLTSVGSQGSQMSIGKIERMKDILLSAQQQLKFFSNNDEIFTTQSQEIPDV